MFAKRQNGVKEIRSCWNWSRYQPSDFPHLDLLQIDACKCLLQAIQTEKHLGESPWSSERRGKEKQEGKPGFYLGTRNVEQRNREGELSWEGNGDTESYFIILQTLMIRTPPCKKHIQVYTFQRILSSEIGDSVKRRW